jgi:hypothetical protein
MTRDLSPHERHYETPQLPPGSDRSFGWVFATVFAVIGFWPVLHRHEPRWWLWGLAVTLVLIVWLAPHWLAPLNRAWFGIGNALNKVVSPLIMALVFFVIVTPTAWLRRRTGSDVLGLRNSPEVKSYWRLRDPPGPEPDSLKNQF